LQNYSGIALDFEGVSLQTFLRSLKALSVRSLLSTERVHAKGTMPVSAQNTEIL